MTSPHVPYGRQIIDEDDIDAVVAVLRSDWLTTGPAVTRFEAAFGAFVGAEHAVAVANGTAALHVAMLAAGVGVGDEVIVAAMTFAASANAARYVGADVVFADVREDTLTIDPGHVAELITDRTRAIVAVDYAGIPCDLDQLLSLAERHSLTLIEDASHAPGATYRGRPVGGIADLTTFSFHPVKHLTTGEGGMVATDDGDLAERMRQFRNHGIVLDFRQREEEGTWAYDMSHLGFNYRLSDINCALGLSQLEKLPGWVERRREIAGRYSELLKPVAGVETLLVPGDRESSWHLYPIRYTGRHAAKLRRRAFETLRGNGFGVTVHYIPVYLHSYYRELGYEPGLCPVAESAYEGLLSLPMWPGLEEWDQDRVVELVDGAVKTPG